MGTKASDPFMVCEFVAMVANHASIQSIGLGFVAVRDEICAVTITAVQFPKDVNGKDLLGYLKKIKKLFLLVDCIRRLKARIFVLVIWAYLCVWAAMICCVVWRQLNMVWTSAVISLKREKLSIRSRNW